MRALSAAWFNDIFSSNENVIDDVRGMTNRVPGDLQLASKAICVKFKIDGVVDPLFIANLFAQELVCGDGCGHFKVEPLRRPEAGQIDRIVQRLARCYPAIHQSSAVDVAEIIWGTIASAPGEMELRVSRKRLESIRADVAKAVADGDGEDMLGFYKHVLQGAQPIHARLETVVLLFRTHGDGLQLKHAKDDRWAIVLPDVEEGKFRFQIYDKRGFSSHQTFDHVGLALAELAHDGYTLEANGSLDALASTPEWAHGTEVGSVIQAMNSKQISWKEGHEQLDAIALRYPEVVAAAKVREAARIAARRNGSPKM